MSFEEKSRAAPGPRSSKIRPLSEARPRTAARTLFIRDLVVPCAIGVHAHERGRRQRVRIDVSLTIAEPDAPHWDRIEGVPNYDDVVAGVQALVESGHVNLAETLAERIADLCLADRRIARARVRVEKLDVLSDGAVVGVEVERVFDD